GLARPTFTRRSASLSAEEWSRLKSRGASCGVAPSALLLTAFAEVLCTWSRTRRFSVVLTLFNRLPFHPEVDQIVGDFTSTSLFELRREAAFSFAQRARQTQRQLWQDLDHRHLSGVELARDLARSRGGSLRAASPVVFTSTLDLPAGDDGEDAADVRLAYSISQTPQVLLDHQVAERAGSLAFNWDAVEEAFAPGVLTDMFAAYTGLLRRLVADPGVWTRPV